VTGGHLAGEPVDVLFDGRAVSELGGRRVPVGRTHGTGCALSAAVTAGLASGRPLVEAVADAKRWLTRALEAAPAISGGRRPADLPPSRSG
jgi:hydroxymethylpyrimidine/phosphomethylpyrimidine kinase